MMRDLQRTSTVDALADALRREILDGALAAGAWLRERELCESYGVARHRLRAALRALASEGLVTDRAAPRRQRRQLTADDVRWLYELRAALELEAAHLALERNGGRLPPQVHKALAALEAACAGDDPPWSAINEAHAALHTAIVGRPGARASPPLTRRSAARCGCSCCALRPHIPAEQLAADHAALVAGLERDGPAVLREHLRAAAETLRG